MENLIHLVLRHPLKTYALLIVSFASALLATIAFLKVDGDLTSVLRGASEAFGRYEAFDERFAAPSSDEVLLVTADDLSDAETFRALEDLVIDLQFAEGVRAVLSIFSIPDSSDMTVPYLSRLDVQDLALSERLAQLWSQSRLARQILAQDRSMTLLTIVYDPSLSEVARLTELEALITQTSPRLDVRPIGLRALEREIAEALRQDQAFLTPIATIAAFLVAIVLFRSWRAALICILPGLLGTLWWFGALAALGVPLTPFSAIVPTVLMVLALADSVHVFHTVWRHRADHSADAAIAIGMTEVAPAIILTSLTTAGAFLCLLIAGSPALEQLAFVAPLGLLLTILAVFLVLPNALSMELRRAGATAPTFPFAGLARAAIRCLPRSRWIAPISLLALAGAIALVATFSETGFRFMEHVPQNSAFRQDLERVDTTLQGSGVLYVVVETGADGPEITSVERARIDQAFEAVFGERFALTQDSSRPIDASTLIRLFSEDGSGFALPVAVPLNAEIFEVHDTVEQLNLRLEQLGLADETSINGYVPVSSVEMPRLVGELRTVFYAAVAAIFVMIFALTRSLRLAVLALVPSVLPILGVELLLILLGLPLTIVGGIALTIAFGIAVDDTIHLLNRIRLVRKPGMPIRATDMATALNDAIPPIVTTSVILIVGFCANLMSQLPSLATFGQLVLVAILLALLADLFLFPSLVLWARGTSNLDEESP